MTDRELTEKEKDEIAELAANKAYDRFYQAVGKSVTKKILWILGAVGVSVWMYLNGNVPK